MKKVFPILIFLAAVLYSSGAVAQKNYAEQFISRISRGEVDQGFRELYATNPHLAKRRDAAITEQRINLQKLIQEELGTYRSHSRIANKWIGDLMAYSYFVNFEHEPLRFIFHFYKVKGEWKLYSFSYDDLLADELEEAMRAYYLISGENSP